MVAHEKAQSCVRRGECCRPSGDRGSRRASAPSRHTSRHAEARPPRAAPRSEQCAKAGAGGEEESPARRRSPCQCFAEASPSARRRMSLSAWAFDDTPTSCSPRRPASRPAGVPCLCRKREVGVLSYMKKRGRSRRVLPARARDEEEAAGDDVDFAERCRASSAHASGSKKREPRNAVVRSVAKQTSPESGAAQHDPGSSSPSGRRVRRRRRRSPGGCARIDEVRDRPSCRTVSGLRRTRSRRRPRPPPRCPGRKPSSRAKR